MVDSDKILVYSLVCLVHLIPSDGGINLAGISLQEFTKLHSLFHSLMELLVQRIHPIHSLTPHCPIITLHHPQQWSSTGPCMRAIWKDKDSRVPTIQQLKMTLLRSGFLEMFSVWERIILDGISPHPCKFLTPISKGDLLPPPHLGVLTNWSLYDNKAFAIWITVCSPLFPVHL